MKKIAIITDAWHPQVNGVVTTYARIISLLEKRGYDASVIHPGLFRTIPLPFYPEIRLALFPRRRLKKMLDELSPEAIHIAVEGPLGVAARALCTRRGIPFTTAYHTHFQLHIEARVRGTFLTPAAYAILRWFHGGANTTMVATKSLKTELEKHGLKHLVLWPLGVDTELFKRNPAPPLPQLRKPVFMYFGRLAVEKSPEEFLALDLPGTKLVIGDGPDRAQLEKRYGASAVFTGYKRGQELVDWLSLSDVFVFPSRSETFGLVVLEALACGVPVVAHDVMGPRDIITEGVDGYLSEDLGKAAQDALSLDPAHCRETAERYSWKRSADAFVQNLIFF